MKLQDIKGLGNKRLQLLADMGIHSPSDCIAYLPSSYVHLDDVIPIDSLETGAKSVFKAHIVGKITQIRWHGLSVTRATVADDSGQIECVWYQSPYAAQRLIDGEPFLFYGRAEYRRGKREIVSPTLFSTEEHGILPVYKLPKGFPQSVMRTCLRACLENVTWDETFDSTFLLQHNLLSKAETYGQLHFPKDKTQLNRALYTLNFEELFLYQLALRSSKIQRTQTTMQPLVFLYEDVYAWLNTLPFAPTNAQRRVIDEILNDMQSQTPMNRLLQGDVGSGKTVVAAAALYACVLAGFQGAFMVPTEILAIQHYNTLQSFLGTRCNIALFTGAMPAAKRKQLLADLQTGKIDILIGTHTLIQKNVSFARLGLAVTDEQHRFGVQQRASIYNKGEATHMLVMSATPIPRTMALLVYGDLDFSVIDELPIGRKAIQTFRVPEHRRIGMYEFIAEKLRAGGQCYIICPLVEQSEALDAKNATDLAEELRNTYLSTFSVGLVHGRMTQEKEAVIEQFRSGLLHVLVATTVVEVGMDVPNANIMVIEDAERFGLAQLHQLRGRIGRGNQESFCFLISADAKALSQRLPILTQTTDGFEIAQKDLELRGPGDLLGFRQHGLEEVTGVANDVLVEAVHTAVQSVVHAQEPLIVEHLLQLAQKRFANIQQNIAMN